MVTLFDEGDKLRRIGKRLEDPQTALKVIGALMVSESQGAFRAQSFGGKEWKDRAPINVFGLLADFRVGRQAPLPRRFERRPALRDTGRLAASIAAVVEGNSVVVGTNLPYGSVHNFGGPVESVEITKDIRSRLWAWLRQQTRELKRSLGWLLNRKLVGTKLKGTVPQRQFVGVTPQTRIAIRKAIGREVFEVRL